MANNMFVALGWNSNALEAHHHPKTSPYLQSAVLIFAPTKEQAFYKAKKLLGDEPKIVKQISWLKADFKEQILNSDSHTCQGILVADFNDTGEGLHIHIEGLAQSEKAGK